MKIWKPRISGKSDSPKEASPLMSGGIKYTAPLSKPGYVEAWKIFGNEKIWEAKVYDTVAKGYREKAPRANHIISLREAGDRLIVVNEENEEFEVNKATQKVTRVLV
jgi:hypothetical protein